MLFIVEGEKAEKNFLKYLIKKHIHELDYECYVFGTCIYSLYEQLEGDLDRDILLTLKEIERDKMNKNNFNKYSELDTLSKLDFTDIFLIFDFDPHTNKFNANKILEMQSFFSDSTDIGKLYTNYPMIESYKHLIKFPDDEFYNRYVTLDDLKVKNKYKKEVNKVSCCTNYAEYEKDTVLNIISHHMNKAYYLIYDKKENVSTKEIYDKIDFIKVLEYQINLLESEMQVSILNTNIFFIVDFNPNTFFNNYYLKS